MLIDIRSLTGQPGSLTELDLQISQEAFGLQRDDLSLSSPVLFTGTLRHTEHGMLILSGQVKASFTGICARCLKSVSLDADTQVQESFEPAGTLPDNGEMQPGDTYGYAGLELDIGQALRDNLIPLLPVRVICQEEIGRAHV